MRRALELAALGPAGDANPQVGCVILAPDGTTLAEGHHRGAGTAHAEADAIADARRRGIDLHGATAVVTLEPCDHTGRTGPCSRALLEAGVARVVHALTDPGRSSSGGAKRLVQADVEVVGGVLADEAMALIGPWYRRAAVDAVHLVLKTATTLDGRIAAADGSSRWITGAPARTHAHAVRSRTGAIIVGTGTVAADDPELTARLEPAAAPSAAGPTTAPSVAGTGAALSAEGRAELAGSQPLRVVVGRRPVPADAAVRGPHGTGDQLDGGFLQVSSHDPVDALVELATRGIHHAVLEGGPTLASAFLRADLVDEIHAYIAPVLLGAGRGAVGDLGIGTIADARRFRTERVERLGEDVLLIAHRAPADLTSTSSADQQA